MDEHRLNKILEAHEEYRKITDPWFDRLPMDINMVFIDNDYVNALAVYKDKLLQLVVDDRVMLEELYWFMDECEPVGDFNKIWTKNADGQEKVYVINDRQDFINYLKEQYVIT